MRTVPDLRISACTSIVERDGNAAWAFNNRSLAYQAKGDFDRTLSDQDEVISLEPNSEAYNGRCWLRATMNRDVERGLGDCDEAIRLAPDCADCLDSRGSAYLQLGQLDKAIDDYTAALTLDPHIAASLYGAVWPKYESASTAMRISPRPNSSSRV